MNIQGHYVLFLVYGTSFARLLSVVRGLGAVLSLAVFVFAIALWASVRKFGCVLIALCVFEHALRGR